MLYFSIIYSIVCIDYYDVNLPRANSTKVSIVVVEAMKWPKGVHMSNQSQSPLNRPPVRVSDQVPKIQLFLFPLSIYWSHLSSDFKYFPDSLNPPKKRSLWSNSLSG